VSSLPVIRRSRYEVFKRLHVFTALIFLSLMFWHAANEFDSWHYLYGTLVIWTVSICVRLFYKTSSLNSWQSFLQGYPTIIHKLSADAIRVDVFVPQTFKWRPGQHAFIRLPGIGVLDNHPFTIASARTKPEDEMMFVGKDDVFRPNYTTKRSNQLRFIIRPHSGFTKRLQHYCCIPFSNTSKPCLRTIIDGPYGTYIPYFEKRYRSVLLVAGGGGITAILPFVMHLSHCMSHYNVITSYVRLVWIVRSVEYQEWICDDLKNMWSCLSDDAEITVDIFVTNTNSAASSPHNTLATANRNFSHGNEVIPGSGPLSPAMNSLNRRNDSIIGKVAFPLLEKSAFPKINKGPKLHLRVKPRMEDIVDEAISKSTGARTAVVGCGPTALTIDLCNAVANAQIRVWKGECKEIFLHTETFDW
jgi:hypothetical protein